MMSNSRSEGGNQKNIENSNLKDTNNTNNTEVNLMPEKTNDTITNNSNTGPQINQQQDLIF